MNEELRMRYEAACHAMQTGVFYTLQRDMRSGEPKSLRTGVNAAMVEHSALARLLIQKGVITEEEYFAAITIGMEEEAERYEQELSERYGIQISLL